MRMKMKIILNIKISALDKLDRKVSIFIAICRADSTI